MVSMGNGLVFCLLLPRSSPQTITSSLVCSSANGVVWTEEKKKFGGNWCGAIIDPAAPHSSLLLPIPFGAVIVKCVSRNNKIRNTIFFLLKVQKPRRKAKQYPVWIGSTTRLVSHRRDFSLFHFRCANDLPRGDVTWRRMWPARARYSAKERKSTGPLLTGEKPKWHKQRGSQKKREKPVRSDADWPPPVKKTPSFYFGLHRRLLSDNGASELHLVVLMLLLLLPPMIATLSFGSLSSLIDFRRNLIWFHILFRFSFSRLRRVLDFCHSPTARLRHHLVWHEKEKTTTGAIPTDRKTPEEWSNIQALGQLRKFSLFLFFQLVFTIHLILVHARVKQLTQIWLNDESLCKYVGRAERKRDSPIHWLTRGPIVSQQ